MLWILPQEEVQLVPSSFALQVSPDNATTRSATMKTHLDKAKNLLPMERERERAEREREREKGCLALKLV